MNNIVNNIIHHENIVFHDNNIVIYNVFGGIQNRIGIMPRQLAFLVAVMFAKKVNLKKMHALPSGVPGPGSAAAAVEVFTTARGSCGRGVAPGGLHSCPRPIASVPFHRGVARRPRLLVEMPAGPG